jgi:hypothetical protein
MIGFLSKGLLPPVIISIFAGRGSEDFELAGHRFLQNDFHCGLLNNFGMDCNYKCPNRSYNTCKLRNRSRNMNLLQILNLAGFGVYIITDKSDKIKVSVTSSSSILTAKDTEDFIKYFEEEIALIEDEIRPNTVTIKS